MSKNIANENMTLIFTDPGVVATVVINDTPSTKVKAITGVYQDGLQITVTNITKPSSGATIPDPGPYIENIASSSTKVKAENKLVLLEGDKSGIIFATPGIPLVGPSLVNFRVEIGSAGQIKAKAV